MSSPSSKGNTHGAMQASSHNGVQLFISFIWPATSAPAALASLLLDPPEPQIIGKTQCFATFLPFRAPASSLFWLYPSLIFSISYLLPSDFLRVRVSSWLCFSSVHIVGSFTSKLPSMICFVCLFVCLFVRMFVCLFGLVWFGFVWFCFVWFGFCFFVWFSLFGFLCLFVCLFVCLLVCLFVCLLFVCLFVCLFWYQVVPHKVVAEVSE